MSALFNPSPLVLGTLQNLSLILDRSTSISRSQGMSGLTPSASEARAFGGIDMNISRGGQSKPAKMRYGAITISPRAQGSAFSKSPGVHPSVDRAYDNPGVRFGDRTKGHERPISSRGESSCHFSQTSVSKTSPIREMIKAARGGRKITGSKAAAHVLYVERDGAPEQIKKREQEKLAGERFTAEIEKKGLDRSAVKQQEYIERPGAAEGMERTPQRTITDDDLDDLETASFGTIGDTVEERTQFWMAVEENERSPKGDTVKISPAENPEWWTKAVAAIDTAPSFIQEPIRGSASRNDMEPFEIKLATDKAFKLHQWAVGLHTEAPLEISPGRGGRTQTRVIAELPHELDGRERLQIVKDFTDKLAEKGFPFWAVIHAPDANNDARNFHVHIAYYDRPSARMPKPDGTGEAWDFTIGEEVRFPNRHTRMTYPFRQNRDRETHDREWITDLRTHWETVSNRALDKAGVAKRYNLGTYESMGIEAEPLKHINSRTFNKERKGELTEEGPVLARRQWDNVHDRLVKENEEGARARKARIEQLADHATRLVGSQPNAPLRIKEVQNLKDLGIKASLQLALLELHQDLTRLVADRVASRAKLMMNAADKEEEKTRKKRGLALDAPPVDRPVAGASALGLRTRGDLAAFLTTIYGGVLTLDRDNDLRTSKAKSNVQIIVQELREWIRDPGRAPNVIRRFTGKPIQSLNDPDRIAQSSTIKQELAAAFQKGLDARAPEILAAIRSESAAPRTSAPSATPSAQTKPVERPQETRQEAQKPRYVPGRPEASPVTPEPPRRPRPAPFTPEELKPRPATPPRAVEPSRPVATTPAVNDARTAAPRNSEPQRPAQAAVPAAAPIMATAKPEIEKPTTAAPPAAQTIPVPITPNEMRSSETRAQPTAKPTVVSSVNEAKRILAERQANPSNPATPAIKQASPVTPGVSASQPQKAATAPVAKAPTSSPQPVKIENGQPQRTDAAKTPEKITRRVERPVPNLAAIMDSADRQRQKPKTDAAKPAPKPDAKTDTKPVELQIVGAKKPDRKKRERDRGRER